MRVLKIAGLVLACLMWMPMERSLAAQVSCALPVELPPEVSSARLVFLGEYHGTQETPLFAAEFACTLAQRTPVTLALEMSQTEQSALDAYLASNGSDAAHRALLSTPFWQGTRDGRASTGTLAMIERVRLLRDSGLRVDLLALDGVMDGNRDKAMAARLRKAMDADAQRRFVVLGGNVHTRKARGSPINPDYESMAFLLRDVPSLALNVVPESGAAWICPSMDSCGPVPIQGPPGAEKLPPELRMGYSVQPGYDGTVLLPKVTVAEPAAAR